jgi:hypothetical protein
MLSSQLFQFGSGFKATDLDGVVGVSRPFSVDHTIDTIDKFGFKELASSENISPSEFDRYISDTLNHCNSNDVLKGLDIDGKDVKHLCIPVCELFWSEKFKQDMFDTPFLAKIMRMKNRYNIIPIFNNKLTKHYLSGSYTNTWDNCVFNVNLENDGDDTFIKNIIDKGIIITNSIIAIDITWLRCMYNIPINSDDIDINKFEILNQFIQYLRTHNNLLVFDTNDIDVIIRYSFDHPSNATKLLTDFSNSIIYTSGSMYYNDIDITSKYQWIEDGVKFNFKGSVFTNVKLNTGIGEILINNPQFDIKTPITRLDVLVDNCKGLYYSKSIIPFSLYQALGLGGLVTPILSNVTFNIKDINEAIRNGYKSFISRTIEHIEIEDQDLEGVNFTNSRLCDVIFYNCRNFDKAIWIGTDITDCEFVLEAPGITYDSKKIKDDEYVPSLTIKLNNVCDGSCRD